LIHEDRLVLLDYEVVHWGDPAFDVGFSLAHFLSKAHYLVPQRHEFAAAAQLHWQSYRQAIGAGAWQQSLEPRAVQHTLACLLARVAGRSPLEYLTPQHRSLQQKVVCDLIHCEPGGIESLIDMFLARL
jgi:hypothetical protein